MNENAMPAVKPVGPEVLSRLVGLVHSVIGVGDSALSLLFRVALAPVQIAASTVEFLSRTAVAVFDSAGIFLHAIPLLLHAL